MNTTRRTQLLVATVSTLAALVGACAPLPEDEAANAEGAGVVEATAQPLTTDCKPGPHQVALFVDADRGGHCAIFSAPRAPAIGMVDFVVYYGFPNDAASSIVVGDEVTAILFDHGSQGGSAYHAPSSGNLGMNDKASSMMLLPKSRDCWFNPNFQPQAGDVAVWDEANYGGRCHVYRYQDRFDVVGDGWELNRSHGDNLGGWGEVFQLDFAVKSDTISSVKVGPGTKVTLFKDAGLMGTARVIESDVAFLGKDPLTQAGSVPNDTASSLKIELTR